MWSHTVIQPPVLWIFTVVLRCLTCSSGDPKMKGTQRWRQPWLTLTWTRSWNNGQKNACHWAVWGWKWKLGFGLWLSTLFTELAAACGFLSPSRTEWHLYPEHAALCTAAGSLALACLPSWLCSHHCQIRSSVPGGTWSTSSMFFKVAWKYKMGQTIGLPGSVLGLWKWKQKQFCGKPSPIGLL